MPTTRKKVIKTVYKDDNDSEPDETGDFSDSGSDAKISEHSSSEDDHAVSSGEEFVEEAPKTSKARAKKPIARKKVQYAKTFIKKIRNESQEMDENVATEPTFTVKDLTDADKLLPSFLNLSESDSSEDESLRKPSVASANTTVASITSANNPDSEEDVKMEYQDVWAKNISDNSEVIAQKTFKELEVHKAKFEETKASVLNYTAKTSKEGNFDVKDLLAQGEEVLPDPVVNKNKPKLSKNKKVQNDSDSEMEDWEEVKESKALPASGLQVIVDFPDAVARKSKTIDLEMMMKRKMNRVKKEYQVYMHKVHVLCWLGHGNYVSSVLNNQEIMSVVLSLVPSKECYPGERVDIKYVEQIVKWFNNKLTIKQDKHENKFKPKAPPLREILLKEIKNKVVSTKKYMVFIFVSMLRALGLQCRVMFNFVTLPIKPPSSELCSLSSKVKDEKKDINVKKEEIKKSSKKGIGKKTLKENIPQLDGNNDSDLEMQVDENDSVDLRIMQVDGSDDGNVTTQKSRKPRLTRRKAIENTGQDNNDVSPPKRARKSAASNVPKSSKGTKTSNEVTNSQEVTEIVKADTSKIVSSSPKILSLKGRRKPANTVTEGGPPTSSPSKPKPRETRSTKKNDTTKNLRERPKANNASSQNTPEIMVTDENNKLVQSNFFANDGKTGVEQDKPPNRKRSQTTNPNKTKDSSCNKDAAKSRSKSASNIEKSKYFNKSENTPVGDSQRTKKAGKVRVDPEDQLRVCHRDIKAKRKITSKNDVTSDLIDIIETRMSETSHVTPNRKLDKGKIKKVNKDDIDYQPEDAMSDEDFKPTKISPKPSSSRKIDRRVISTDDEAPKDKSDVWCEIFVEELEQWIAVDVVKGKVHCTNEIYGRATHPVCYVVGWDNNNYLKDLTRRYVPHWNTVTRKQRAEPVWWEQATAPWRGPKTARDKEEDDSLDRMQLDAPLPKSIAEYKNHPLYALRRHLLKYEALYPPDAASLGFVRNEPVFARECVYVCRSRDTWLKEAKVVKLGEKPYKIVKARPKWDKLSNKCITDKPLEIFGPWQVQDYEPPVAENGIVPRNAYGNVELFKDCMLPKGTVHVKLPGLNRVAKKLNIDCAPAMTGFDFNGGWSHPVYDGFVVCKEFEEVITEAWLKDQEDQERREREKTEARVYGHWKRLIKGLMIRERLKLKYGFEDPSTSDNAKKAKGPRLVVKKR